MRYVLVPVGTYGDVAPFAAIGRQLAADGHDVTLLANEKFRGLGNLPFEAHSTVRQYDAAVSDRDVWTPGISAIAAWEHFGEPAAIAIRDYVAEHASAMIMASPLAPTAFAAGRGRCLPLCQWAAWREMAKELPALPPGWGLWPEWFAEGWDGITPTYFPVLDDGLDFEPDEELSEFVSLRPTVITFGSGANYAGDRLDASLEAIAAIGQPGVVLGGPARDWPLGVIHRDFVPLRWLLPFADALIHHGGIGTVAAALETATPQIILPIAHDHFFNAQRVQELGAGIEVLDLNTLRKVMHAHQTSH